MFFNSLTKLVPKGFCGFHPEQSSWNQMFLTLARVESMLLIWVPPPLSVSEDYLAFCSSLLLFPVCPASLLSVLIQHVIMLRNNEGPLAWRRQRHRGRETYFQHFFRPLDLHIPLLMSLELNKLPFVWPQEIQTRSGVNHRERFIL